MCAVAFLTPELLCLLLLLVQEVPGVMLPNLPGANQLHSPIWAPGMEQQLRSLIIIITLTEADHLPKEVCGS